MRETSTTRLEQRKDRRGLLALIGAGGAAAVAALLGRGNGAEAAPGDPFILGEGNSSGGAQTLVQADRNGLAFRVDNNNTGSNADGIRGETSGSYGWGVDGLSHGSDGTGVRGRCTGAYGTGVSGRGGRVGVSGVSKTGTGVLGKGRPGVYGQSTGRGASGVRGDGSAGSIGVFANNYSTDRALRTKGRVQMDCARKVMLSDENNLVTLPRGVTAGTSAAVFTTIQGNPGNHAIIKRAHRVDNKRIRIVFDKAPARPVRVAYWIIHTE